MRILLVTPLTPEWGGVDIGGIAVHAQALARHLTQAGHDVAVIADNVPFASPWPRREDSVAVFGIKDFKGPVRTRGLASPAVPGQVARTRRVLGTRPKYRYVAAKVSAYREVLRRFRPDVIHVHGLENRTTMVHVVDGGRTPTVVTAHSTHSIEFTEPPLRDAVRQMVRWNLRRAREVVFVSEFLARRFRDLLPDEAVVPRATVIPNPIEASAARIVPRAEARRELGIPEGARVALFVGNLIERKDPGSFVRAVAALVREGEDIVGMVVGDGPLADSLRHLARDEGADGAIRFEGAKSQDELAVYYSAADVFVLPSLMESFGLVLLEAMSRGTPVVAVPGVAREVVPEYAGLAAPPADPVALAAAVQEVLRREWDSDLIAGYARGFDWSERIGEYETLYEQVIARHR